MTDGEWIASDNRRLIDEPTDCTGCGQPTRQAEVLRGVVVGWDDLCWQRCVVRWRRRVVEADRQTA